MKKVAFVALSAALLGLAACNKGTTGTDSSSAAPAAAAPAAAAPAAAAPAAAAPAAPASGTKSQ